MKKLIKLGLSILGFIVLGAGPYFYSSHSKPSLQKRLVDELTKRNIPKEESPQQFEYEDLKNRFKPKEGTIEAISYKWEVDKVVIGYRDKVKNKEASIVIPSVLLFYAPERKEAKLPAIKVRDVNLDGLNKKVYHISIEKSRKYVTLKKIPLHTINNSREHIMPKKGAIYCLNEDDETAVRERYDEEKDKIYQLGDLINKDGWSFDEEAIINAEIGVINREERRTANRLYNRQIEETIKDICNYAPTPREEEQNPKKQK